MSDTLFSIANAVARSMLGYGYILNIVVVSKGLPARKMQVII